MFDTYLIKLQYEILNLSLSDISTTSGIPVSVLEREASSGQWKRRWPDSDFFIPDVELQEMTNEDIMERQVEYFTLRAKKRIATFQLLKEQYLLAKYANIENLLLAKVEDILDTVMDATSMKACTQAFKDLSTINLAGSITELAFEATDDAGIPLVVMRNMSGTPIKALPQGDIIDAV